MTRSSSSSSSSSSTGVVALLLVLLLHTPRSTHGLYHTSSELLHWFSHTAAKSPSLMRFRDVKEHHTGTVLPVAHITQGADAPPRSRRKPVVLFVFGEHARELITSEVGLWLARLLVDNSSAVFEWPELADALQRADNSSSSSSSSSRDWPATARAWVQELLVKVEVQIVPIESLDSRRQLEEGQLCVRKTARNVDLNRNWPFAWQQEDPTSEQYGGTAPFSEPQSRLMRQVVDGDGRRLLGYVNVHSGEWALYTPWDSKPAYGSGLPADMPDLVATVGRVCGCKVGPAGAVSGYLAFGSSMDYLYVARHVPYPLTVEVYGGGGVGKLQPGDVNKPLTEFELVARPDREAAAAVPLPRRHILVQQQASQQHNLHHNLQHEIPRQSQHIRQQQQQQAQQVQVQTEQQQQQQPERWSHLHMQHSQQHGAQHAAAGSARRHPWRRRLQYPEAGSSTDAPLPAAAVLPSRSAAAEGAAAALPALPHTAASQLAAGGSAVAAAAAAAVGGGLPGVAGVPQHAGFTHAQRLPSLRHQALLQITKSQLEAAQNAADPAVSAAATAGLAAAAALQPTGRPDPVLGGSQQQQQQGIGNSEQLDQPEEQQQQQQQQDAAAAASDGILGLVAKAGKDQQACFSMFNPPTEAEYRRVVGDWLASFLLMARHMAAGEAYAAVEATVSRHRSSRG